MRLDRKELSLFSERRNLASMPTARKKRTPIPADGWLSVTRAAEELDIAHATVLQRALRGELEVQIVSGRTFVSLASIEKAKGAA